MWKSIPASPHKNTMLHARAEMPGALALAALSLEGFGPVGFAGDGMVCGWEIEPDSDSERKHGRS
jgi:hypothetical protein